MLTRLARIPSSTENNVKLHRRHHLRRASCLVTRSDIYVFDTTQDQLRFNPLLNDEIPGTRQPQPIRATPGVGTNGKGTTGENLLPNGFKLISASLLDDEKRYSQRKPLHSQSTPQKVDINSGFLKFEPKNDAKGLARIEYIIEMPLATERQRP